MSKQNSEKRLRDYMNNPEFAEFQNVVDEAFKELNKKTPSDCVLETIVFINKLARKLNDDDCYEVTSKLKDFFIWCQR